MTDATTPAAPAPDALVRELERRLIDLARGALPPGRPGALWASAVGTRAEAGMLAEDAAGPGRPVGAVPAELLETLVAHREAVYARDGRTWVSLVLQLTAGGGAAFTLGAAEPLPWAPPPTDADWDAERRLHPGATR